MFLIATPSWWLYGWQASTPGGATTSPDANLVSNADFLADSGPIPAQWLLNSDLRSKGTVNLVPQPGGAIAVELRPNTANTESDKPFALAQLIPAAGLRGLRLRVQAAMKVTRGTQAFLLVFQTDRAGRPIDYILFEQLDAELDFRPQRNSFTVNPAAENILIACSVGGTTGAAQFTQLSLRRDDAAGAGSSSAGPASAAAADQQHVIEIDALTVLRPVERAVFGSNIEWFRNGNGIWDDSRDDFRETVLGPARELGVSVLRYPGGGLADHFHWYDSIGPRFLRPTRPHVLDEGSSKLLLGLHEFIALCRRLNAEPLVQVNVVTGSAEEAAEWVDYANRPNHPLRTANGSAEPFAVRFWEIGNEQYIRDDSANVPATATSYLPPSEYVKRVREFSDAMKARDPSIQIGAVAGRNFGRMRLVSDENWNEELLTKAGEKIDFLAVHNAYAPVVFGNDDASRFYDVYRALLAFPKLVEENLRNLNLDIETYAPAHAGRMRIAITEWGPLFAYDMNNRWIDHSKTLGSALFTAGTLNAFLRSGRVFMANFFKLAEDGALGTIQLNGNLKPSYFALQIYAKRFGSQLIQTNIQSARFSTIPVGLVSNVNEVPYLDAVSSLNADGSRLYLIVVNRNATDSIDANIRLRGFVPEPFGEVVVLTGDGLDANNGADIAGFGFFAWAGQATAPDRPLFHEGKPGTVFPAGQLIGNASEDFIVRFEPRSITSIELRRR